MATAFALFLMLAFATVVEYIAHRWYMHRRGASRYHPHHVRHHGRGDNSDELMDFSLATAGKFYAASLPVVVLLSWSLWAWFPIAWTAFLVWWFFAWKATHRLIHDDRRFWWARVIVPYYPIVLKHHREHHRRPTRNFGALFFWSDLAFGTRAGGQCLQPKHFKEGLSQ